MTDLRADDTRLLWVGTYPEGDSAPGTGEGVWGVALDVASGRFGAARQVIDAPSPSFVALAPDEGTLYAVTEADEGSVTAFRVSSGALGSVGLEPLGTVSTRGAFPCHVVRPANLAAGERRSLWVANYGSGGFTTIPLTPDGAFAGTGEVHDGEGTGPVTDRQEGPHAHYAVAAPDGAAWVVDLGADRVRRYVPSEGSTDGTDGPDGPDGPDGAVMTAAGTAVELAPGTGPRHLVIAPQGTPGEGYAFVVGELDNQVHVLRLAPDADGQVAGSPVSAVPACATAGPEGVGAFPSHVALSPDGSRLYLTVRGPDVVSVFAVGAGELRHLADSPLSAAWPRHFAVLDTPGGDVLVVAGQSSSTLEALRVAPGSGRAEPFASLALPRPACVVERRILEG